ncbi:MAG: hypothetical protein QM811_24770 [Pirellulales bacterium]
MNDEIFRMMTAASTRPPFANGAYRVVVCDGDEIPSALRDDWNRLSGERAFSRWEWQRPWWNAYRREGMRLRVLVVCDPTQRVVGIAPWYRTSSLRHGKTLRFLGDNQVCTDYQALSIERGYEDAVVAAVSEWLLGPGATDWHALDWRGHAQGDAPLSRLSEQLERRGARTYRRTLGRTWRIALPTSWDGFLRETLSRKRRDKGARIGTEIRAQGSHVPRYVDRIRSIRRGLWHVTQTARLAPKFTR